MSQMLWDLIRIIADQADLQKRLVNIIPKGIVSQEDLVKRLGGNLNVPLTGLIDWVYKEEKFYYLFLADNMAR